MSRPKQPRLTKPGQPLPPEVKRRCAEMIGLGLSHVEAAGALGISPRSVATIMSTPQYRRIAEDISRQRGSMQDQAASVVRDLLGATKPDGSPDHARRKEGATLYAQHPELLDGSDAPDDDDLLPGCVHKTSITVFPSARYGNPTPNAPDDKPSTFSPGDVRRIVQLLHEDEPDLQGLQAKQIEDILRARRTETEPVTFSDDDLYKAP